MSDRLKVVDTELVTAEQKLMALAKGEQEFWEGIERRKNAGENVDPHAERAAVMFEIPVGQVTANQRRAGKTLNFRNMYSVPWASLLNPPPKTTLPSPSTLVTQLEEDQVFSIRKNRNGFILGNGYDSYYQMELTAPELAQLATELLGIANGSIVPIDESEESGG